MKKFLSASALSELADIAGKGFSGVCFGAEFCPWRLPSLAETRRAKEFCAANGLEFVAVTPVAVESQFDRVCRWLAAAVGDGCEWVANDLGVLKWAKENGITGVATAGRMVNRQQRGPRLAGMVEEADALTTERLKGSLWDDPLTVAILMEMGATRFALDSVRWGIGRPALPSGAELVAHGPYAVVTWSPWCHFRRSEVGLCGRDCMDAAPLRLENEEEPTQLWTRGNAVFTKLGEAAAERIALDAGAWRYVFSPGLPC